MPVLSLEAQFESNDQVNAISDVVVAINQASDVEIQQQTEVGKLRVVDDLDTSGFATLEKFAHEITSVFSIGESELQTASVFFEAHPNRKGNCLSLFWYTVRNPREHASRAAKLLRSAGGANLSASTLGENGATDIFEP